LFVV
jgi:hypothetical protein